MSMPVMTNSPWYRALAPGTASPSRKGRLHCGKPGIDVNAALDRLTAVPGSFMPDGHPGRRP